MTRRPPFDELRTPLAAIIREVALEYGLETGGLGAKQKAEQSELIVAKSRLTGQLGVVPVDWDSKHRSYQEG